MSEGNNEREGKALLAIKEAVKRLAQLSEVEYEVKRKSEAKELDIGVGVLDSETKKERERIAEERERIAEEARIEQDRIASIANQARIEQDRIAASREEAKGGGCITKLVIVLLLLGGGAWLLDRFGIYTFPESVTEKISSVEDSVREQSSNYTQDNLSKNKDRYATQLENDKRQQYPNEPEPESNSMKSDKPISSLLDSVKDAVRQ
jgi:hypothetical protein